MSHLSPDRFCAVLGAEGVGLGRWHANQRQWLGSRAFSGDAAQPAWQAALQALAALLAEHAVRGACLQVLLSARFSRFCLVPWSDAIGTASEEAVADDLAAGNLVRLHWRNLPPALEVLSVRCGVVSRSGYRLSPAARAMIETLVGLDMPVRAAAIR